MAQHPKHYHFCGVGGSGMSALAKVIISKGHKVSGSDRNYDRGLFPELYDSLKKCGVTMIAQDGCGVKKDIDSLIVSSAVEPSIPDVKAAQDLNVPIVKRAELLAQICNDANSITVAGTNGKSTTTAMIGWVLADNGLNPTIINGGGMINFNRDNAVIGDPSRIVVETDESDGSITNFHPNLAVLTNISEDHKDMNELLDIFRQYLDQSNMQVLNIDCPHVAQLAKDFPNAVTYSVMDWPTECELIVDGEHNRSNAMATMAVARICHLDDQTIFKSLQSFQGVVSRLEVVGKISDRNITVIDDFGHNPDKITASLKTLKQSISGRLILMYQPHAYGPTRRHKNDLIDVFSQYLKPDDIFFMPEIYYAGGSVDKDISSNDIVLALQNRDIDARFMADKVDIEKQILDLAQDDDTICIMGARDDSLRQMAKNIYTVLKGMTV